MKKLSLSSALNIHEFPKDDYLTYIRQCFTAHKELGFDAVDFSGRTYALMGDQPEVYIEKTLETMDKSQFEKAAEASNAIFNAIKGKLHGRKKNDKKG